MHSVHVASRPNLICCFCMYAASACAGCPKFVALSRLSCVCIRSESMRRICVHCCRLFRTVVCFHAGARARHRLKDNCSHGLRGRQRARAGRFRHRRTHSGLQHIFPARQHSFHLTLPSRQKCVAGNGLGRGGSGIAAPIHVDLRHRCVLTLRTYSSSQELSAAWLGRAGSSAHPDVRQQS